MAEAAVSCEVFRPPTILLVGTRTTHPGLAHARDPVRPPDRRRAPALSLGRLTEADLARVSAHLGDCPDCCRRIEQVAADDPLLALLQQEAAHPDDSLVTPAQCRAAVRACAGGRRPGRVRRTEAWTPAPVVPPPPRQVGDYEILAEVGRGGMGVVYRARHRGLHRPAALKMVLAGEFASPAQELRFRLEAELAARVRHPNIVQVYEIGSHEGRPFLALEWVEGGSLADRLDGTPWLPDEAAALVETLARAIHVAHGEGVVHRDLKPANIMRAGADGSGGAGPSYKITDFGLAQPTEGGQTLTRSGFLVGTPGYMAPEQAAGKRALVGPATDIYALGVVLYQLLTGQLPFQADSTLEVLRGGVGRADPAAPLTAPPAARPGGHHAALPGEGARPPLPQRPGAGRRPPAVPGGEAGGGAAGGGGRPAGPRVPAAPGGHPVALPPRGVDVRRPGWSDLEVAGGERAAGPGERPDAAGGGRETGGSVPGVPGPPGRRGRGAGRATTWPPPRASSTRPRRICATPGNGGISTAGSISSSSVIELPTVVAGLLAGAPDRLRAWAVTGAGLRVTDLEGGEHRSLPISIEHRRFVTVAQTRRGLRVAAWVGDAAFELLGETGQILCRVAVPGAKGPWPVAVSPDGTRLACIRPDGEWVRLRVFDAKSGQQTAVCDGHRHGIWAYAFSPDGTRLVSGGEDRTARFGTRPPAHCWRPAGDTPARSLALRSARTERAW